MNQCWVLLTCRGLRLWLPPEVYLNHDLALREAARWRQTFRIVDKVPKRSPRARSLHIIQTLFPEPWRACPVWVGFSWSERSYPRMKLELMAADETEAAAWLRKRTPKTLKTDKPGQAEFERRGALTCVGVFRVKRVMGF
jgi:hypothetical protein